MRAAVTTGPRRMEVVDVPEQGGPGSGQVAVAPVAVGICGSDLHYFLGDLGTPGLDMFPRIQGHEICAVVEAVGPDVAGGVEPGERVAVWPVHACGACYPCSIGRANVCANLRLVGIHFDGALQERLVLDADHVVKVADDLDPAVAALVEPVSIAVSAVRRARLRAGERAVVLGAGPIGQAIALAARDRGAEVLLVDRLPARLALGRALGAETVAAGEGMADRAGAWAGAAGPEVVFEATGVPELVQTAVDLVSAAGRVMVVGLSATQAPLRVGDLAFRELDLLGVSCCTAEDFAAAADLVSRRRELAARLVTHEYPLDRAPDAIAFALDHPAEVMKAVVRV
jgi:threonine dehydrogenase-like Zn-dependent dehydrogenase